MTRLRLLIRGTVQGVGFRPHVHRVATSMSLAGYVANTAEGVVIEVEGAEAKDFPLRLRETAPPLARIMEIKSEELPHHGYETFTIETSLDGDSFTLVPPDIATCDDCLREFRDPNDRRHRYPFINCTNCGPRYTITRAVPYDRPNTSMDAFTMCPACRAEYEASSDRRFHAVPNACPACGPRLTFVSPDGTRTTDGAFDKAMAVIRDGGILALKGLGGFHLACDATNRDAVGELRARKRKSNKPFALMARDMETVAQYCQVSEHEATVLASPERPVTLLIKREGCALPEAIAPRNRWLGVMLPYTPLHHMIMDEHPLCVMTSGNRAEEPIESVNERALESLGKLADAWLVHDRGIFTRVDDSVVRSAPLEGGATYIRRSRGFAPNAIPLAGGGQDVIGAGADLKNTFTLMKDRFAIVSQHIGDLENYETLAFYEESLRNLRTVYRASPVAVAHDLHPGYHSTRWALSQEGRKLGVQHHHAHIASVLAEKGITDKVIGIAMDGTGYGPDGTVWGGEFMVADARSYQRLARFMPVPLPGGEAAVREPWRMAVSHMHAVYGADAMERLRRAGFLERHDEARVAGVLKLCEIPEHSPLTSSAGRLFDAVAALIGLPGNNTFEGEAAIALESIVDDTAGMDYAFDISEKGGLLELDFGFTVIAIVSDLIAGIPRGVIAGKFHHTMVQAVSRVSGMLARSTGLRRVALSGGVFQNPLLLEQAVYVLEADGLIPLANEIVPPNDGGVSLGQAYVLRETLRAESA